MESYFGLLRRHGLMLWISFLVGSLAAGIIAGILALIIIFIGGLILFAGTDLLSVFESIGSEATDPATAVQQLMDTLISPGLLVPLLITAILLWGVYLLYSGFTTAGMNTMLRDAVFEGRSTIETYFTQGFRYMLKMMGQLFLIGIFHIPVLALFVAGTVIIMQGIIQDEPFSSVAGGLLLFLIGVVLVILLSLVFLHAPVILVTENKGIWESIALSARLFAKSFGQVFLSGLLVFLIYLVYAIFIFIVSALLGINSTDPSASAGLELFLNLIQFVLSPLVQAVSLLAVFYRYRNLLRSRLFPEWNGNGGENGGTTTF